MHKIHSMHLHHASQATVHPLKADCYHHQCCSTGSPPIPSLSEKNWSLLWAAGRQWQLWVQRWHQCLPVRGVPTAVQQWPILQLVLLHPINILRALDNWWCWNWCFLALASVVQTPTSEVLDWGKELNSVTNSEVKTNWRPFLDPNIWGLGLLYRLLQGFKWFDFCCILDKSACFYLTL